MARRAVVLIVTGGVTIAATVAYLPCNRGALCSDMGPKLFEALQFLTDALRDRSIGHQWANPEPLPAEMVASGTLSAVEDDGVNILHLFATARRRNAEVASRARRVAVGQLMRNFG